MEVLSLSLVESEQEGVVGEVVELSLSALTHHSTPFTHCHTLPYVTTKLAPDFASLPEVRQGAVAGACATLGVVAQQPGFSRVQVAGPRPLIIDLHIITLERIYYVLMHTL